MLVVFLYFFLQNNLCSKLSTLPRLQMRFYLHMSGDGIGTLSVLRRSHGGLQPLLNLTGDQGNYWQMKEIPLSDSADFQVVFEGKVGRSPKGDVCLDDITFSPGCLLAPAPVGKARSLSETSAGLNSHLSLSRRSFDHKPSNRHKCAVTFRDKHKLQRHDFLFKC